MSAMKRVIFFCTRSFKKLCFIVPSGSRRRVTKLYSVFSLQKLRLRQLGREESNNVSEKKKEEAIISGFDKGEEVGKDYHQQRPAEDPPGYTIDASSAVVKPLLTINGKSMLQDDEDKITQYNRTDFYETKNLLQTCFFKGKS